MKKYLVLGGAGFIGSNLVEDLVGKGEKVIVVDNLSTGNLNNLSRARSKIKFVKARAGQVLNLKEVRKLNGIYHFAIPSSTPLYRKNRLLIGESINEFIKVLELARREKCKVVFASSSSVYNGNKPPFKENLPVLIKDFYTEARYLMERLAKLYYDFYGVKSIGLRFFSVYGPKEKAKKTFANLVSQFLWSMKKGKTPVIYGNGSQERDFTYVEDIVKGLKLGMNSSINCDIFNLGTGKCYNLNQLVKILNKILRTDIKPTYIKNPLKNYVDETLADTKKAKTKLDFEAKISLEEGIKKILNEEN